MAIGQPTDVSLESLYADVQKVQRQVEDHHRLSAQHMISVAYNLANSNQVMTRTLLRIIGVMLLFCGIIGALFGAAWALIVLGVCIFILSFYIQPPRVSF